MDLADFACVLVLLVFRAIQVLWWMTKFVVFFAILLTGVWIILLSLH